MIDARTVDQARVEWPSSLHRNFVKNIAVDNIRVKSTAELREVIKAVLRISTSEFSTFKPEALVEKYNVPYCTVNGHSCGGEKKKGKVSTNCKYCGIKKPSIHVDACERCESLIDQLRLFIKTNPPMDVLVEILSDTISADGLLYITRALQNSRVYGTRSRKH